MNAAAQLAKLERRAIRAALHPLLLQSLTWLRAGGVPLTLLAEIATALLKCWKHSREQRRALRRIEIEPRATDADLVRHLLEKNLFPLPARPTSPAVH